MKVKVTKKRTRPDVNENAFRVVQEATGQKPVTKRPRSGKGTGTR